MEEAKSIEEFIKKAKNLEEKILRIQPYVLINKNFPCLRIEGKNVFYEKAISKRFEKLEDAEEFVKKLSYQIGKEFLHYGFYTIVSDLKYINKRVENVKEDDIEYLLSALSLFNL